MKRVSSKELKTSNHESFHRVFYMAEVRRSEQCCLGPWLKQSKDLFFTFLAEDVIVQRSQTVATLKLLITNYLSRDFILSQAWLSQNTATLWTPFCSALVPVRNVVDTFNGLRLTKNSETKFVIEYIRRCEILRTKWRKWVHAEYNMMFTFL